MRRLRQMQQTRGRPGGGGGGPPPMPKGSVGLVAGGLVLLGGVYVLSNSLFNVDGGHRAIKYRRVNGVSKEIYNEGEFCSRHPEPPVRSKRGNGDIQNEERRKEKKKKKKP